MNSTKIPVLPQIATGSVPRKLAWVFLGTLCCIILFFNGQAAAGTRGTRVMAPSEGWGRAYEHAAIEYWGEAADCATADVEFDSMVPYSYSTAIGEKQVLGRALVTEGPGEDCWMYIAPLDGYGIYFRCVLFAHEYGHWLGIADDPADKRTSVSYELLGNYTVDPPCRKLVLEAHHQS